MELWWTFRLFWCFDVLWFDLCKRIKIQLINWLNKWWWARRRIRWLLWKIWSAKKNCFSGQLEWLLMNWMHLSLLKICSSRAMKKKNEIWIKRLCVVIEVKRFRWKTKDEKCSGVDEDLQPMQRLGMHQIQTQSQTVCGLDSVLWLCN